MKFLLQCLIYVSIIGGAAPSLAETWNCGVKTTSNNKLESQITPKQITINIDRNLLLANVSDSISRSLGVKRSAAEITLDQHNKLIITWWVSFPKPVVFDLHSNISRMKYRAAIFKQKNKLILQFSPEPYQNRYGKPPINERRTGSCTESGHAT